MNFESYIAAIRAEAAKSRDRWGPYRSTHEALGVLLEDGRELADAIHANDLQAVSREAIQVAAVAARLAHEVLWDQAMAERSQPEDPA